MGFSVYPSAYITYNAGEAIKCDLLYINPANYYNTTSGEFICPVTGAYFITLTGQKAANYKLQLGVKHGQTMILHLIDTASSNGYNTAANSRLVECNQGDVMTIITLGDGKVTGGTNPETTFSGMLMETNGKYIAEIDF